MYFQRAVFWHWECVGTVDWLRKCGNYNDPPWSVSHWFCLSNYLSMAASSLLAKNAFPFSLASFPTNMRKSSAVSCSDLYSLLKCYIFHMWEQRNTVCSICLMPIVCFYFEPVSGLEGKGKFRPHRRLSKDAFRWASETCAGVVITYLPRILRSLEGVYCSQSGLKWNLCSLLWNFQFFPNYKDPNSRFRVSPAGLKAYTLHFLFTWRLVSNGMKDQPV